MKQGKIYIAGPMGGIPLFNFPAFDKARDYLMAMDWAVVVSPADMDREIGFEPANLPGTTDWSSIGKTRFCPSDAIKRDIEAITDCGAIYMLEGWEGSLGAKAEHAPKRDPVVDIAGYARCTDLCYTRSGEY